ncbi:LPS export ABC transporter periplasmic protein LptC [Chitinimonas arctica]|uniref:LPS export ABC transporter periplasmic protein LptC n=1 Tax=Chitinimonas arctica TaxID=2594795 RepID=A0A516SE17_9NEIS|nr:LPS export ABC transporter periplasmic protein LptC [Chitinimonas arctica]QDQ26405.1 LPS export ABC transporter periplasmic protein LptC [Chitinimonas arctica]
MLPDRAARAFPLLLLGLLAGLALLLDRATNLPYFTPNPVSRDPDLSISQFEAIGFGQDGKPLYTLAADKMQHYPRDDRSEFTRPRLVRTLPGEPQLNVVAARARMLERGNRIDFDQDVQMTRVATPALPAMTLRTSNLRLDTERGLANSDAPADLSTGGDRINATGFDYDHTTAQLMLRSKVRINYASPKP